jgi:hypothetical protein
MVFKRCLLLTLVLAFGVLAWAQTSNLTCNKNGNDVRLSWSGGTSPYHIVRATSPTFYYGNVLLGDAYPSSVLDDANALQNQTTFFYDVSGTGEPPADENNPAQSPPIITTLTLNNGKPADTVVIDGNNFGSTPEENMVSFGVYLAEVTAASVTQLTVIVPPDTLTDLVTVTVGALTSNGVMFYRKFGAVSYSDLSSICFEDGNGSVWVADRATVDKLIEIFPNETQTIQGGYNENVISDLDVSATWIYYGVSLYSGSNIGNIRRWNVSTNTFETFRTIGSTSDPVQTLAITPDPLTPDLIYVSDGYRHVIRRVPKTGTIDQDYGNMGSVTFNNPAGLRCDSAGNLYATTANELLKITPAQVVTYLLTGLNGAAGIDVTERSGFPIILIAEEGTGKVLLYNTQSGIVETVATGLTQPSGVAFTENLTTGELFYDVIEPTRVLRLPDPIIDVKLTKPAKVLIHKYRPEDPYPSEYQTQDGRIKIEVELRGYQTIPATVYFQLVDPKDPSYYASGSTGDNVGGPGSLSSTSASVVNGKASVDLIITDRYAGDNYRVLISTQNSPFKEQAHTPIITAWKRIYIEKDRMYKVGQFLTADSGKDYGTTHKEIFISNTSGFAVNDQVHVLGYSEPTGEMLTVESIVANDHLVVSTVMTKNYPIVHPTESYHNRPYVAKISAGTYDINPARIIAMADKTYKEMFVDYISPTIDTNGPVPNEHFNGTDNASTTMEQFSMFYNGNINKQSGLPIRKNHIYLVAGEKNDMPLYSTNLGTTISTENCTFLWFSNIPANNNVIEDVLSHEFGHQWAVNSWISTGHCNDNPWNNFSGDKCLMNESRNAGDGNMKYDINDASDGEKDLYTVRNRPDDLDQF